MGAVDLGGARQRRLLAALIAHANEAVSTDRLVDIVFEEDPPAAASTTIRSYVARLRRALEAAEPGTGGLITTEQGGYGLRLDMGLIDAERFEATIETARGQLADRDAIAATATLREGLELWRGEAYGEFALEEWARPDAMRLDELKTVAQEELNDSLLACGLAHDVVSTTRGLIDEHPLREKLRAQHMLALYRAGRQAEALRSLTEYEQILIDVGLEPSNELLVLGRSIAAHDPALRLDSPAGQPLRGYRIGAVLGEGAHGVVYRAVQPGVGREVAIKTIRAKLADDPAFVRRFDAEAQLVAHLEHPHIVPIYDYWREPGGAYIVMRLLRANLGSRLASGPLDVETVSRTAHQLGSALAAAHRAGVVHGDIKPSNVLIDDESAFLADFGVATLVESVDHDGPAIPSSGYESPEQLSGERPGPASDQFALAVLLVQLLTGTLPFGTRAIATHHDRSPSIHVQRPSVPAAVDAVVWRATAWEPEARFPDVETFVEHFEAALEGWAAPDPRDLPATNPYKGLQAFTEADQADFYGRDAVVDELVAHVDRPGVDGRFVVAIGASGSGKSSVVRAGLIPRLRLGAVPGSDRWLHITMVPGTDPFAELDAALRSIAVSETPRGPRAPDEDDFSRLLCEAVPSGQPVMLVIDQLEELFTLVADEGVRRSFLDGLTHAVSDGESGFRVAATLRADFLDRPLRYADFGRLIKRGAVTIVGMSAPELEAAITQPAAGAGVEIEPTLATQIVADVIDQPAALPLLQFTLTELFDQAAPGVMTLESYVSLGGVESAVARRAEAVFEALAEADRDLTRRMFLRLAAVDDTNAVSRRRARRTQLVSLAADPAEMDAVVDAFGLARLLTFDHDLESREPTVEVAHEALIQHWPRFRDWVTEAGEGLRVQNQVALAAQTWDEQGRDQNDLARGLRLESALELTAAAPDALDPLEHEFVRASGELRTAEAGAQREQAIRDRRSNRRLRTLLVGVGLLLVVALIAGFLAVGQRNDARDANEEAELAVLISDSAAATLDDPELALLLALEAHRRSPQPATEQAVLNALGRSEVGSRVATFPPLDPGPPCPWGIISQDGLTERPIVDGRLLSRDLTTGEVVDHGPAEPCGVWFADPATNRTVVGCCDGARHWIGQLDDPNATEVAPIAGDAMFVFELAGDRMLVLLPSENSQLVLADADTGEQVGEPFGRGNSNTGAAHPDGDYFAVGFLDLQPSEGESGGQIHVVDGRTGNQIYRLDGAVAAGALTFDTDTDELLAAIEDGTLRTFDLATGEMVSEVKTTATSEMMAVGVRPDGLVVVVSQGQIELVDRRSGPVGPPTGLRDVVEARVRPDGAVLTVLADDRMEVIDLGTRPLVEQEWQIDPGHQVSFNAGRAGIVNRFLDGPAEILDVTSGVRRRVGVTRSTGEQLYPSWLYPEENGFWTIDVAGELALWEDGEAVERFDLGGEVFTGTRFGDLHAIVVDQPGGRVVHLYDVDPDGPGLRYTVPAPEAATVHPSLDGGLHVLDVNGTLHTYDAPGELTGEIETEAKDVLIITLDPATGTLAVGSNPGGIVLIDTATGQVEPLPDADPITNLGFARDGDLLVITGSDGTVRLWDLARGVSAGLVWDGTGAVPSSPSPYDEASDSIWVATSGLLLEVPLDPQRWVERACEIVGRDLTQDEWDRWIPGDDPLQSACD